MPGRPPGPVPGPNYSTPPWAGEWHREPSRGRGAAIAACVAALVAVIIGTVVIVTHNPGTVASGAQPVGSQQPPTPYPSSTGSPTSASPRSTDRSTRAGTTDRPTEPVTTAVPTTRSAAPSSRTTAPSPRTTAPSSRTGAAGGTYAKDRQDATRVAEAWTAAVNAGDDAAVVALSCRQDRAAFGNGTSQNPAVLSGHVTVKLTSVITARPHGIAMFSVTPATDSSSFRSLMVRQDESWKMCATVSRVEDL